MNIFVVLALGFLAFSSSSLGQGSCGSEKVFTARTCSGDDHSPPETELYGLITRYRSANGQREIALSPALSMLANRHLIDIKQNVKTFSHSWSNCPYDIARQETWPCITDAPTRLNSGYDGQGYETIYRTEKGSAQPALALEAWKKSALHNSIILGQGMFKNMPWNAVGIAIDGNFAAVWFGYPGTKTKAPGGRTAGIGVSFDEAVDGLVKILDDFSLNPR